MQGLFASPPRQKQDKFLCATLPGKQMFFMEWIFLVPLTVSTTGVLFHVTNWIFTKTNCLRYCLRDTDLHPVLFFTLICI